MARESFVTTPFVDVDPSYMQVRSYTPSDGEPSVVLDLGGGLRVHVYDPALLVRLAEVVARGRDLLGAALSGQDPLPVDTRDDNIVADDQLIDVHSSSGWA